MEEKGEMGTAPPRSKAEQSSHSYHRTKVAPPQSDAAENEAKAKLSRAVSSALLLAATVGLVQLGVYSVFCKGIIRAMGLSPSSPMWSSAVGYLQVRAWGTPAATLWLVSNGIFRGLGDTATPLVYSLLFTGLNAVLDPLFIFVWHWGAAGAAAGTALAQYVALVPLLLALHRRVPVDIVGQFRDLGASLREYVQAGSLVLVRSFGKVLAYAVCARQAAVLGSVSAAAYNLTFQLGFATTQICEAVAVAVQTLLARELADKSTHRPAVRSRLIRHLISTSVGIGGAVASILSLSTYWRRDWILKGLTTNASVQAAAASIFPVVLLTQVLKGMAYPVRSQLCGKNACFCCVIACACRSHCSVSFLLFQVNGIIMGGLDWVFSMLTMWMSNVVCVSMIWYFARGPAGVTLGQIWWALAAFMGTQVVAGIVRYESKRGVWSALAAENVPLA
jgi:putative MATE family efflux protein